MARSYPQRRFPGGPYIEPQVQPALRGPKRTGPIGELVPGDDVEVARILARKGPPPRKLPICYGIKLTGDALIDPQPTVGDGYFIWMIPEDVVGLNLAKVEFAVSNPSSSGNIEVQLRKIHANGDPDVDLLLEPLVILQDVKYSEEAPDGYLIDTEHSDFEWHDEIAIDFDAVGTGPRGYLIHFWFL